jgi:hypothetical protein
MLRIDEKTKVDGEYRASRAAGGSHLIDNFVPACG